MYNSLTAITFLLLKYLIYLTDVGVLIMKGKSLRRVLKRTKNKTAKLRCARKVCKIKK